MSRYSFWFFLILLVVFRFVSTRPIYHQGDKIRITASVISEPVNYGTYQSLSLAGLKISLPAYPEIHYGDSVVVEGVVEGDKLKAPTLQKIVASLGMSVLSGIRSKIVGVYQSSFPEPHASLIAGIVLGAKSSLPEDFWTALKNTGTMHVVVASGMNVTFVAGFLMGFWLLFFPRKIALPMAVAGIWLYAVISGLQAPIVRAAVMASIVSLAQGTGRVVSTFRILVVTVLLMLTVYPSWVSDLGFILSFVSTASLMLFQPKIEKLLKLIRFPNLLMEDFSTSLSAQIGVAPILFVTFGSFNILSPLINAAVLWTIAPIMILGALGGVIGLVFEPAGRLVLYLAYPLTFWFVKIVTIFG
jgi:competence protein ComEC